MIEGFKSKETEKIFNRRFSKKLPQMILDRAEEKPAMLDAAVSLQDLNTPGNLLEKLSGDRKGQHSIRINDRWRICFIWREGHAYNVEIVDYHRSKGG